MEQISCQICYASVPVSNLAQHLSLHQTPAYHPFGMMPPHSVQYAPVGMPNALQPRNDNRSAAQARIMRRRAKVQEKQSDQTSASTGGNSSNRDEKYLAKIRGVVSNEIENRGLMPPSADYASVCEQHHTASACMGAGCLKVIQWIKDCGKPSQEGKKILGSTEIQSKWY